MVDDSNHPSRRRIIKYGGYAGVSSILGLAGCSGDDTGDGSGGEDGGDGNSGGDGGDGGNETTTGEGGSEELTLIHHWSRGADGEAMAQFLSGFEDGSGISVSEETPSGQGGANVRTIVRQRLLNENAPGSWQGLGGLDQIEFATALKDIESDVWEPEGAKEAYYEGAQEAAQLDGEYKQVPTNLHRINSLYYNTNILDEAGVDPDSISTIDDLTAAFDQIASETDATPFAKSISEPWTMLATWESLFLSIAGLEKFRQFTDGDVASVESEVRETFELIQQYSEHFPNDANSIAWPEAAARVGNGDAAFYHNGDFAVGVLLGIDGFEFGDDWNWMTVPGTEDYFLNVMDTFVYPKNTPTPEATQAYCRWCASVEGQEILNSIKGSIPPRSDVPQDEFSGYQVEQMESIADTEAQPLTITFTHAVNPDVSSSLKEAMGTFTSNQNVDEAYTGFRDAFE